MRSLTTALPVLGIAALLALTTNAVAQETPDIKPVLTFSFVFGIGIISVLELLRKAFFSVKTKTVSDATLLCTSALLLSYELYLWAGRLMP